MNKDAESGFSLVEVLVAFTIMAGAIILSFQIFADGLRRLTEVEERVKAVDIARFELSRLTLSGKLEDGSISGVTEGISWKVTVTIVEKKSDDFASGLRVFRVSVFAGDRNDGVADVPLIETLALGEFRSP